MDFFKWAHISPTEKEIISFSGVERSLHKGKRIHTRRYRNPRLGEFFKELHLTESRGTGFPTIHEELKANGSPDAKIDADDEHTYFIVTIPCHPEFVCNELGRDDDVHFIPIESINVTANAADAIKITKVGKLRGIIVDMMSKNSRITYDE